MARPRRVGAAGLCGEHAGAGALRRLRERRRGDGRGLARHRLPLSRCPAAGSADGDAAGLPGLCARLCLYRPAVPFRRGADRAPGRDGLGAAGLLVPEHPLAARRGGDARLRPLSLRLPARPDGLRPAVDRRLPCRAHPGAGAVAGLLPGQPADGPPGDCRGGGAGGDGDDRRLWHGRAFLRPHLLDRHLSGVVLDGRPRGGGAARALPARLRAGARGAGAPPARQRPGRHPRRRGAGLRAAAAARPRGLARHRLLRGPLPDRICHPGAGARADGRALEPEPARSALHRLHDQFAQPRRHRRAGDRGRRHPCRLSRAARPGAAGPGDGDARGDRLCGAGRGHRGRAAGAGGPARQPDRRRPAGASRGLRADSS